MIIVYAFNPFQDDKILDWSKFKQSADDNFEFDVHCRKFSKLVENTVGKGEIARYEQFILFPVFSKGLFPRGVKRCHCAWKWVKFKMPGENDRNSVKLGWFVVFGFNATLTAKVIYHGSW